MNGLVAGQVSFIAEGSLAAVTLVWLITVDLDHVIFQRIFVCKLGVTTIAEVRVVFCGEEVVSNTSKNPTTLLVIIYIYELIALTTAGEGVL